MNNPPGGVHAGWAFQSYGGEGGQKRPNSHTWTPKVGKHNGLYGYYYGFRAIILHTFGV